MHINVHTHALVALKEGQRIKESYIYIYMCICIYISIHAHMNIYIYIYGYIYSIIKGLEYRWRLVASKEGQRMKESFICI
jgi:hypothetical protein